jgi:acyl carrier protein
MGQSRDYIKTVGSFIVDNFLFGDSGNLQNDTSLLDHGIIDSTGILELVMFLEERYQITIEDHELIPENLDSLNNIAAFLQKKDSSKPMDIENTSGSKIACAA